MHANNNGGRGIVYKCVGQQNILQTGGKEFVFVGAADC